MMRFIKVLEKKDMVILSVSSVILTLSFMLGGRENILNLIASLIGVVALIYLAKGEPLGQILSIVFSIFYAIVSFSFRYYGEMLTYLLMTLPSAVFATYIWLKNPHQAGKTQVAVSRVSPKKLIFTLLGAPLITLAFYFLLKALDTPNLLFSTLSITTSYLAAMFTFFRSRYYAVMYALNDLVLITLWTLATLENLTYLPMVICFIVFLFNDLYAFRSWKSIEQKQKALA